MKPYRNEGGIREWCGSRKLLNAPWPSNKVVIFIKPDNIRVATLFMELTAFVCVTGVLGALLGLGVGAFTGEMVWKVASGAFLTPAVAGTGVAVYLYLRGSKSPQDPQ
jgi:hypothetical protein